MGIHSDVIEQRREELRGHIRQDLLMRRSLLEAAMAEGDRAGVDWQHDVAEEDDPHLTLREQHDLLDEAIRRLPDAEHQPQVVGLKDGLAILRTTQPEENNNG